MKFVLLIALLFCFLKPSLSVCTPSDCLYGIFVLDGSSTVLRFDDNQTVIIATRDQLTGTALGFTGNNSATACAQQVCGANSLCENVTDIIFTCNCESGYSANRQQTSFSCDDVDECTDGTHNCSANANCTNETPGFNCTCIDGYSGNGTTCVDIDECASDPCHVNATCTTPVVNGYNCTCNDGYTGNGTYCEEADECALGTDNCHANATCNNTIGNYTCTCIDGYTGDGYTCEDIPDCSNTSCHANATCTDLVNNYTCACNAGFSGDGVTQCIQVDVSVCITFYIVLDNYTYVSTLTNPSSTERTTVDPLIEAAIQEFVTSVDGSAGIESITHSFANSSDGLGYAESNVTLCINNTQTAANDFLIRVNSMNQSFLNLTASADECSLGIDDCSSDRTCYDSPYRFCCAHDLDITVNITTNSTFNVSFEDTSSSPFLLRALDVISFCTDVVNTVQDRGCSLSSDISCPAMYQGSIVHVLAMLLRNATFTLQDITDQLQRAVNDSTDFGTIISAGDFDECIEDYEDLRNCSALAECLNFAGSFSCRCNGSYYDNGTTPGEICINPITVACDGSIMNVSILRDYYIQQNISLDVLHLADETCNRTTHSRIIGDSIEFSVDINECNTTLAYSSDNSSIVASNYVTNLPSSGFFTGTEINVPFECALPANINLTAGFNGTVDTIRTPNVQASGEFNLEFALFDETFATKHVSSRTYGSSETIYGQCQVLNSINGVSVKLDRCFGTPTSSRTDSESYTFVDDGCSSSNEINFNMISNGNGAAQFSMQMFFFTQVNAVYMHCEAQVCLPSCQQTCSKRRRRQAEDIEYRDPAFVTIKIELNRGDPLYNNGTFATGIFLPGDRNNNNNSGVSTQDIALPIVSAVLAFILIILLALLVLVVVRKRRSNKEEYDMTHVNTHAIAVKPPAY